MKAALYAAAFFVAALLPGVVRHGQPLPHSGSNKAHPVQALSPAPQKPESGLLTLLSRFRRA